MSARNLTTLVVLLGLTSSAALGLNLGNYLSEAIGNDVPCHVCQIVAGHIKELINDQTLDELKKQLDAFCDSRDESEKQVCHQKVDDLVSQLKELLKGTPQEICTRINLCTGATSAMSHEERVNMLIGNLRSVQPELQNKMVDFIKTQLMGATSGNEANCVACTQVVDIVKQVVEKREFTESVDKAARKICHLLNPHDPYKEQECKEITMGQLRTAIEAIKHTDAKTLCSYAGQCAPTEAQKGRRCEICKQAMAKYKDYFLRPETQELAHNAGHYMCSHVIKPKTSVEDCIKAADKYVEKITEQVKAASPEAICKHYHAC